jgi:signal transduction histidine kinase
VEVVAAPADGRHEAASGPDDRGRLDAGEVQPRPKARATQRLEKAQMAAFMALQAVSSYSEGNVDLPVFFRRLSQTVAGIVGARRAAFWRLDADRTLAVQPQPSGFAATSPVHGVQIQLPVDGESILEQIVFRDELDLVKGTSRELDAFWKAIGLAGVKNSAGVSWRVGDRRIGALVVYDSRRGFSSDDVWVLRIAAMATGLMWQYREAEQQLGTTVERLEQTALARRQLLSNIAAGGDEARRRFASSLHDDSLQLLTAAELQLEHVQAEGHRTKQASELDQVKVTLKRVDDSLRRLLLNVSPQALDQPLGLDDAIRSRLETLRTKTGIEPDIDLRLPGRLPDEIGSVILKNVSEALANVERHAHATRIQVSARPADGGIKVVVTDDGKGFVVAESTDMSGRLGLVAIRERAQLAGGRCRIESEPGAGARVEFWVPTSL